MKEGFLFCVWCLCMTRYDLYGDLHDLHNLHALYGGYESYKGMQVIQGIQGIQSIQSIQVIQGMMGMAHPRISSAKLDLHPLYRELQSRGEGRNKKREFKCKKQSILNNCKQHHKIRKILISVISAPVFSFLLFLCMSMFFSLKLPMNVPDINTHIHTHVPDGTPHSSPAKSHTINKIPKMIIPPKNKNAKMQKCKNAKIPKCKNAKMRLMISHL